jgi:signal transduction histidine kinase/HD-GYP domain-containing protein (c-di-GMP phosphodiesterase class II)
VIFLFDIIAWAAAIKGADSGAGGLTLALGSGHIFLSLGALGLGLGAVLWVRHVGILRELAAREWQEKYDAAVAATAEADEQKALIETERQRMEEEKVRAEAEKERISELYLKKIENSRRRAEELAKIIEIGNSINSNLDLDLVLSQVVNAVRESLGFRIVLLRMLNEKDRLLEARAFAGLETEAMSKLEESKIPEDEFRSWLREEFRISGSYFISHTRNFWGDNFGGYTPNLGERGEGEWHQDDVLFVPLWTQDHRLLGYLSVDDPVDRLVPDRATLEMLEIFGNQAVTAIQNARLYTQLEKNMRQVEEAAERMKELNELKNNFVATVSHELRTPLTSITAYVQTLMKYLGSDNIEMQREFLSVVCEESNRLASLIDAILDLSRLEAGKSKLRREEFDAVGLLEEVRAFLRPAAEKKDIKIVVKEHGGVLRAEADKDLIKQALLNMGNNAVKFTPEGGSIFLSVADEVHSLHFAVQDTGIGIPDSEMAKIFDRFYQVDSSTTRQFGGSGLGLAISKAIVEWHDGEITVESELGKGSTFHLTLPKTTEDKRVFFNNGLSEVTDPQAVELIKEIVRMISEVMNAKTVSLMVVRDDELHILASLGLSEHVARSAKCRVGDGVSGWVASRGEAILVKDTYSDPRFSSAHHPAHTARSVLAVPIKQDGVVIGVLNVNNKDSEAALNDDDQTMLCCLSDMLVLAWSRARMLSDNKELAKKTLSSLKVVVDHARRHKAKLCGGSYFECTLSLARELGLDEEEVRSIGYAASVHDVGMRLLDEKAINSADELSERELHYLRLHPAEGARLVMPLGYEETIREIILTHHERFDGTGYPNGLAGDQIPIGGRILAVMDAFEAMTLGRPYRESMTIEEAIQELRNCSGSQFDPQVVGALSRLVRARCNVSFDEASTVGAHETAEVQDAALTADE